MSTVFANGRSIVHKGDGQTNTAAPPDVCKTPTPGGPVPIPYVNIAMTSDLADGTKSIKIEGNPAGTADSNISTSSGDEAGTAGGGLMSSKTKGKLTWATKSSDVKFEGQGVVRFMEITQHNGNTFNTAFQEMGGTGLAYGDDSDEPCPICSKSQDSHRILETKSIAAVCAGIIKRLQRLDYPHGFMVGVASCKCQQILVATSGDTPPEFHGIASSSGASIIVLDTAMKTPQQAMQRIPRLASSPAAQSKFADTWKLLKKKSGQGGGYVKPGNCAGQKLAAQGHVLVAMSEMMYSPSAMARWQKWYRLRSTIAGITSTTQFFNEASGILDEPKGVASCHTCQVLLPMMLCDKDRSC